MSGGCNDFYNRLAQRHTWLYGVQKAAAGQSFAALVLHQQQIRLNRPHPQQRLLLTHFNIAHQQRIDLLRGDWRTFDRGKMRSTQLMMLERAGAS